MRHPTPDTPRPGQESVWDYPRPPRLERVDARVTIALGGERILDTDDVVRVLETSHAPTYYVPMSAFPDGCLVLAEGSSMCEFKGRARYFDVRGGGVTARRAAWNYPHPSPAYPELVDRVAVYAEPMDACTVAGEVVEPQPGNFYGGWVTSWIAGPIKGAAGSLGW